MAIRTPKKTIRKPVSRRNRATKPRQVFISYSWHDELVARKFEQALTRAGFHVWRLSDQLLLGPGLLESVSVALKKSDAMVVILSPEAVSSPWVGNEIAVALSSERFAGRLVPVVMKGTPIASIPWILNTMSPVRMGRSSEVSRAAKEVIRVLRGDSKASAA